jgi:hypothetical protein
VEAKGCNPGETKNTFLSTGSMSGKLLEFGRHIGSGSRFTFLEHDGVTKEPRAREETAQYA